MYLKKIFEKPFYFFFHLSCSEFSFVCFTFFLPRHPSPRPHPECKRKKEGRKTWVLTMKGGVRREVGEEQWGRGGCSCTAAQRLYLQAGFPCAADHPTQSFPSADPLDYMLLLGSLKDQEENLIVVNRGHRGERREDIPNNQQLFQLQHWNATYNILAVTLNSGCAFYELIMLPGL